MRKLPAVNSARTGLRRSGVSWFDHQTNTIWIGEYGSASLTETAARHEQNHFWMHVSTPYGRLLDELTIARNNQVLGYSIQHYHRRPLAPILIPVYQVAKRLRTKGAKFNGFAFKDLCERFARPWSHTVFLENLLEGEPFPEVMRANLSTAMHSLQTVEAYLEQMRTAPDGGPDVADKYPVRAMKGHGALKATWTDGTEFPLGAKHVFEGIATQMTLSVPIKKEDMSGGTNPFYWALWLHWVEATMQAKPVKSTDDYKRFRNTFYALCDLALFVPAGDLYKRLRGNDLGWSAIQPGYRFISLVRAAKDLDWIEDLDSDMLSYQKELSRLLSWPSPEKFLDLGAQFEEDGDVARRHRDACRIRLTSHCAFFDFESNIGNTSTNPSQIEILADRFWRDHHPMIYLPHRGELIVRKGETAGDSLSNILDWFFVNFNWSVMRDKHFNYENFLPAKLLYGETFQNVATRSDLVQLIHQAVPALTEDRFQELR